MALVLEIALGMLLGVVLIAVTLGLTVAGWKSRAQIILRANKAAKYAAIALTVCLLVAVFGYTTYQRSDLSNGDYLLRQRVDHAMYPCWVPPVAADCSRATSLGDPPASLTFEYAFAKGFADTSLGWLLWKANMSQASNGKAISKTDYGASDYYVPDKWYPGMTEFQAELIGERDVRDFEAVWAEHGPKLYFWLGYCITGALDPIYFLLCVLLWRVYKDRTEPLSERKRAETVAGDG